MLEKGDCERCGKKGVGIGNLDYCASCGRDMCAECMAKGCCGSVPAVSGMGEDYPDATDDADPKP